jgi:hypothetical protein
MIKVLYSYDMKDWKEWVYWEGRFTRDELNILWNGNILQYNYFKSVTYFVLPSVLQKATKENFTLEVKK